MLLSAPSGTRTLDTLIKSHLGIEKNLLTFQSQGRIIIIERATDRRLTRNVVKNNRNPCRGAVIFLLSCIQD